MGILAASAFVIFSTISRQKGYSLGKLIFGCDMILLINYRVNWELMCQQKQTQINKDNAHENKHRVEYDYKVGDKVMLTDHTAYKYENPYKGTFVITQCLPIARYCYGMTRQKLGIIYIKLSHINRILKLKVMIRKICLIMSAYNPQLYILVFKNKYCNKVYNRMRTDALNVMSYRPCNEVL